MFSLIITIVSVALVAALALATLYYGGDVFNRGSAEVRAAQLLNEGQQVLGAAELYYAERGAWPTVNQLLEFNYLKTVPVGWVMTPAFAQDAGEGWEAPVSGMPLYTKDLNDPAVCREVNRKAYQLDGVLLELHTQLAAQCFGPLVDFKVAFTKGSSTFSEGPPVVVDIGFNEDPIPDPDDTDAWVIPPGSSADAGNSGGDPGDGSGDDSNPPEEEGRLTVTPFYFPDGANFSSDFPDNDRARREGTFTFGFDGSTYVYQRTETSEVDYASYDMFLVTNNTSTPVVLSVGGFFTGTDYSYYETPFNGTAFCSDGEELAVGESCLVEASRTYNECGYVENFNLSRYTPFERRALCAAPQPEPILQMAPVGNINLGDVAAGTRVQQVFTIANVGEGELEVLNPFFPSLWPGVLESTTCVEDPDELILTYLQPDESCEVTVGINIPSDETAFSSQVGEVRFLTNDASGADYIATFDGRRVAPLVFTPANGIVLPYAIVGQPYSQDMKAYLQWLGSGTLADQSPTWSITSGTMPAGLSLNPATGVISGTPTAIDYGLSMTLRVATTAGASKTVPIQVNVYGNTPFFALANPDINMDIRGAENCFTAVNGTFHCTMGSGNRKTRQINLPADWQAVQGNGAAAVRGNAGLRNDGALLRNLSNNGTTYVYGTPDAFFPFASYTRILHFSEGGICFFNERSELICDGGNQLPNVNAPFVTDMHSAESRSCGLVGTGMICWSTNSAGAHGILGDGTLQLRPEGVEVIGLEPSSNPGITSFDVNATSTCVVQNGAVKCWGHGRVIGSGLPFGSLEFYNGMSQAVSTPQTIEGMGSGVLSVTLGSQHACVLMQDRSVKCWGSNSSGQLGSGLLNIGGTARASEAQPVAGLPNDIISLQAGGNVTCAVSGGTNHTFCWGGSNPTGNLGGGLNRMSGTPVLVQLP